MIHILLFNIAIMNKIQVFRYGIYTTKPINCIMYYLPNWNSRAYRKRRYYTVISMNIIWQIHFYNSLISWFIVTSNIILLMKLNRSALFDVKLCNECRFIYLRLSNSYNCIVIIIYYILSHSTRYLTSIYYIPSHSTSYNHNHPLNRILRIISTKI